MSVVAVAKVIATTIITEETANNNEANWSRDHLMSLSSAHTRTHSVNKQTIMCLLYRLFAGNFSQKNERNI